MAGYPVKIIFRFKSEEVKDEFLGQLSDGWGENLVEIRTTTGANFNIADDFKIDLLGDADEDYAGADEGAN